MKDDIENAKLLSQILFQALELAVEDGLVTIDRYGDIQGPSKEKVFENVNAYIQHAKKKLAKDGVSSP